MRSIIGFISIVLIAAVISGCTVQSSNTSESTQSDTVSTQKYGKYMNISPDEAKKKLDAGEQIILLDVRTQPEYDAGHIPDSMLIPVDELIDRADEMLKDKEKVIFVYCRSGNRSSSASKTLAELGYKNVYNLGGIIDWPYEIEKN